MTPNELGAALARDIAKLIVGSMLKTGNSVVQGAEIALSALGALMPQFIAMRPDTDAELELLRRTIIDPEFRDMVSECRRGMMKDPVLRDALTNEWQQMEEMEK